MPLYDEDDAKEALKLIHPVPNDGTPVHVCEGITASFLVAGHIMGASLVLVEIAGGKADGSDLKFLFSGDLGHYDQPIVKDPVAPPACDYLMVESTYGDRLHGEIDSATQMAQIINDAAKRNGPILIPAFAVGRTQEVLYLIRELEDEKRIPVLPVVVDSPMANQTTQVYNRWSEEHDEEYVSIISTKRHPLRTGSMTTASSREESKRVNQMRGARIIISASGMMSGGRVMHHAMRLLPDENATVVFVGFQAAGTTGRRVQDGEKEVKIMKNWVPVRCHVAKVEGFSAHADWKAVLRWLEGVPNEPKTIFTTHGEPDAAEAMRSTYAIGSAGTSSCRNISDYRTSLNFRYAATAIGEKMKVLTTILFLFATCSVFSQAAKTDLSKVTWLAGLGTTERESGRTTFEQWTRPDGGILLGIGRTIASGKLVSWEFMRIEPKEGSAVFSAQLPTSAVPTPFGLKSATATELVFENLQNDFPHRVIYRTEGRDALEARIEGKMDGNEQGIDFTFKRIKCE